MSSREELRARIARPGRTNRIGCRKHLRNAALLAAGLFIASAGAAAEPSQPAEVQQAAALQQPAAQPQTAPPPNAAAQQEAHDPPAGQAKSAPAPGSDPALRRRLDALEHTVTSLQNTLFDVREQASQPPPKTAKVTTKGGLKVESEDGAFSFQAIGRLQVDAAFYDQDKSRLGDGVQLRRARLGAQGKLFNDWLYKLEADFGRDTAAGTVGVKDAYISYVGWEPAQFTVGNFYEPFGLEGITSETFTTFIERALPITQPNASFAPDRHVGIAASHYDSSWSASVGAFMKSLDDPQPANEGDQQFDVAGRFTYDPILEKTRLLHFGLSGRYSNPSDSAPLFRPKPESNVTGARFLDTGSAGIANVDHLYEISPELAIVYGPASLQGEYFYVPVERTHPNGANSPSVTLTGWYAYTSYFLTGESRNYNPAIARFDRTSPNKNLGSEGGWGAFELAARVSHADFDDGPSFQFGTETNYTLGLNWYANPYIKFMLNYIWVRNNSTATGNKANLLPGNKTDGYDDPQIFELRAQVDW